MAKKRSKHLIAIGPITNKAKGLVSGQSVMFDLTVKLFIKKFESVKVINISENRNYWNNRYRTVTRALSYIQVFLRFILILLKDKSHFTYITVSQSIEGFWRDLIFIIIAKIFKQKVIAHQFGGNFNRLYSNANWVIQKIIKITYSKVDRIIVESEYSKTHFKFLKHNSNIYVINNCLPSDVAPNTNAKNETATLNILYFSNLIFSKGYNDVLEALNILKNKDCSIKCIFVGKFLDDINEYKKHTAAKESTKFLKKIKEYELEEVIELMEPVFDDKKHEIFSNSHVFILPSYYPNEGQPLSLIEAIAYGLVPIITDHRSLPDMVPKDYSYIVEKNKPMEIAKNLLTIYRNRSDLKNYSNGLERYYANNFSHRIYDQNMSRVFSIEEKFKPH